MYNVTQSQEVKQLAQLLVQDMPNNAALIKLKELLHNPMVLEKYKYGCKILAKRCDLATTVNAQIPGIIFGNPDKITEIENYIDKIRFLTPSGFSKYISQLELILTKGKNYG